MYRKPPAETKAPEVLQTPSAEDEESGRGEIAALFGSIPRELFLAPGVPNPNRRYIPDTAALTAQSLAILKPPDTDAGRFCNSKRRRASKSSGSSNMMSPNSADQGLRRKDPVSSCCNSHARCSRYVPDAAGARYEGDGLRLRGCYMTTARIATRPRSSARPRGLHQLACIAVGSTAFTCALPRPGRPAACASAKRADDAGSQEAEFAASAACRISG